MSTVRLIDVILELRPSECTDEELDLVCAIRAEHYRLHPLVLPPVKRVATRKGAIPRPEKSESIGEYLARVTPC